MSYQTKGKLNTNLLCLFTASEGFASSGLMPQCGWRDASGVVRAGTWLGGWEKIERAWALDTWGKWQSAAPILYQAIGLKILDEGGSAIEPARENGDLVFRIASGAAFRLDWLRQTVAFFDGVRDGNHAQVSIFDGQSGALSRVANSPALPFSQTALPDGSYIVHVQYSGIIEGLRLPPGYTRDPQYNYETEDGRESHYNPVVFVGEVPLDPNHELNVLRRELITSNQNQDNPDYAKYVTYEGAQSGEASAIKLHVGAGAWTAGAGVLPTPSRALCELDFDAPASLPEGDSPSTPVPVAFDPLAHVVSRALHTRANGYWQGKVLLGGARLTDSGPKPALWQWNDDNTATLLGIAQSSCEPVCEQLLSTGLVMDLAELNDGSIVVLGLCSRHRYDPNATGSTPGTPETRLPRWPLATDGEPGGRAMVALGGNRIVQTTEALGRQPDPNTPSFYNVLCDVQGEKIVFAPGTLANVDGCLWNHRGKAFGVRCDGDPTDAATREQITFYDGLWNRSAPSWRAAWLVLQRGASVNGLNLCFGWVPDSQTAQVVRDDGKRMQVLDCDYRLRAGTLTRHAARAELQSFIAPAREVVGGEMSNSWSLIELDGGGTLPDGGGDDGVLPTPDPLDVLTGAGDDRKWRVLRLNADEPIHVLQIRDAMESRALKAANADLTETGIGVRVRVDSSATIDDFGSYLLRPRLDKGFVLPVTASEKVEVLIVTRAELAPEQLPLLGAEA